MKRKIIPTKKGETVEAISEEQEYFLMMLLNDQEDCIDFNQSFMDSFWGIL